eukprot:scpid65600/ scgid4647/ Calcium-binding protein p22; Calcineurin B homolog; Calcineurin homologous protein; Calcium-binding protein CHP
MGSHPSRHLDNEVVATLVSETGFSRKQIQRLHCRFSSLDKDKLGCLKRSDLEHISELHINPLGVRIIDAFFPGDRTELSFPDFVHVLAVFRPGQEHGSTDSRNGSVSDASSSAVNSREKKLEFVFSMYDVNNDGVISKNELSKIFQMMVGVNVTTEQLGYVLELTLEEAAADDAGDITFEKFKTVMKTSAVEEKLSIRFFS